VSVMGVMYFMRCSFVTDQDQPIHLSGSLIIIMARTIKAAESSIEPS
jgi:hypothetical protein